jgi:PAS domain S-box-containing protein
MKRGRSPLPYLQLGEARRWLPFAVLAGALSITLIAALYVNRTAQAKDLARFENSVRQISITLTNRLDTYVALLRAGSGLFAASDSVEPDEFHRFVAELDLPRHYPGIQGIGFSQRLRPEEREHLIEQMRRAGNPDFKIKPEGERPEYHTIIYLEPMDRRNEVAIGYDMFTDPVRRQAMERARDTGLPAASGPVTLVQEIEEPKQSGFLIYSPVYRKGSKLDTVAARQAALMGFVYSPFRTGDLLPKILNAYQYKGIDYQVFAGQNPDASNALYNSNEATNGSRFGSTTQIRVADSQWSLKFNTSQGFEEGSATNFATLTLLGGGLLSVLLFAITRSQTRAHARAVNAARELKHSEKSLRRSLRERETTEEALRRSKADLLLANYRFQVAEEASKSFHYDWNLETDTVVRSENFSQVLGYSLDEIAETWEAWKAITHAEDFPISKDEAIEYLNSLDGDKLEAEYRVLHKDGSYRNLYNRGIILRDDQGRPRRVIGQTVDITERKKSEEDVRVANARYRELFENANDIVYTLDLDGRLTSVNKAGEGITGFRAEELLGRSISDLLSPGSISLMSQMLARKLSGETRTDYELEIRTKSGKSRTLEISSRLIMRNGEPEGIQGIARDVTDRKVAEQDLLAANERAIVEYERLLERIAALAQELGASRELLSIYQALREFTLASVPCHGLFVSLYDEVKDVRTASYGWGDGLELDVSDLPPMPVTKDGPNSRAVRTGEVVITDDYMKSTTGHPQVVVGPENGLRPQSSMAIPMSVMGRVLGTIEVQSYERLAYKAEHATAMRMAANLTAVAIENAQLLARESQAREEAEESNRLKDEFLATVSHELRTPLTAILGWARLLENDSLGAAQSARAIQTIQRNAKVQAQIIDDILDVSRIVTGNLYLEFEPTELAPILEAATNVVRPTADAKHISIDVSLSDQPALVSGDADRLQQIVWNLLSNAIKFTPAGGRVRIETEQTDSHVFLRITDSGQGITAEFLPHVFERFRQADSSTTRRHGGLGLGLAIARHLVEIHGGSVVAQSEGEGRGATFTVVLPLVQDEKSSLTREHDKEATSHKRAEPADLDGVHVLLVDDDAGTREMLSAALNERHARVTAVASAREALNAIINSRPDVLVSDIAMPIEDGYNLIERVRALESASSKHIPAVAITAYAREEDRRRALAAGYQSYLPKPIEPAELIALVADLKGQGPRD